jgi:hypothetical protein
VAGDRLDLLRRLTAATPHWALVKNEQAALGGSGDVDSAAPVAAWPTVLAAVSDWAGAAGVGPVLACDHIAGMLVLAVVEPTAPATLTQVDVLDHKLVHGRVVLRADDLVRSADTGSRGYRRLTGGAEGIARLLLDEWSPGAPQPSATMLRELADLIDSDPDGTGIVAASLPSRLRAAVARLAAGTWPRADLLRFELEALLTELRAPGPALGRLARAPSRRSCPLLRALARDRTVPGAVDEWASAVHNSHSTGYS